MAYTPTVYITASDQHRNGKTLLARLLADYLLLDGRDPFMIDTDAPDGPLRNFSLVELLWLILRPCQVR